jgi:hypothetical protein
LGIDVFDAAGEVKKPMTEMHEVQGVFQIIKEGKRATFMKLSLSGAGAKGIRRQAHGLGLNCGKKGCRSFF